MLHLRIANSHNVECPRGVQHKCQLCLPNIRGSPITFKEGYLLVHVGGVWPSTEPNPDSHRRLWVASVDAASDAGSEVTVLELYNKHRLLGGDGHWCCR